MKRLLGVAAALFALTSCGLPLPGGVQEPGTVTAEQGKGGDIQVLPPGPRDDAPADQIVRDFFGAQSNPSAGHVSARAFLAPAFRAKWKDTGPVSVFGGDLDVRPAPGVPNQLRVTGAQVGRINADGSYDPQPGRLDVAVSVRQGSRGRWQITAVPNGLLLSTADRDRSFRAHSVYYLAPSTGVRLGSRHLAADQVFLPVNADSADALVRRLLQGPSVALRGAVDTAFPAGTGVTKVGNDASGLVTVELSNQVAKATSQQQEQMSAQLVWTLRGSSGPFARLRLRSAGRQIRVEGTSGDQDRSDWASYDPDGLPPVAPAYYIAGRRLRVLDPRPGLAPGAGGKPVVDLAAVSPRSGELGLIARTRTGEELRTGPSTGPFVVRTRSPDLTFPSWGSGEHGLWFLERGRVMLARPVGPPVGVPVDGIGAFGPITGLRVSRDGVRVALLAGSGSRRRLVIGRTRQTARGLRVDGLRAVAGEVADVRDLSWDGPVSLVVLGRILGVTAPVRVAVDGSSVALITRLGLELSTPLTVAAAPERPLVVGASVAGQPVLFRDNGRIYVKAENVAGSGPVYPG